MTTIGITRADLAETAKAHLRDAKILRDNGSYNGAVYLCGYAVELALKSRICQTLDWPTFPPVKNDDNTKAEGDFRGLFTHDPNTLLWFSGMVRNIKPKYLAEWSIVGEWKPDLRYSPVGSTTLVTANERIEATETLLGVLL